MIAELRNLTNATPFVPFTIQTANGRAFQVPTVDHIAVTPAGKSVFVFGDQEGEHEVLSPLLIAHLNVDRTEPATPSGI